MKDKLIMFFCRIRMRIEDKIDKFKWRCQRFKRGYADIDVWNMNDWFIDIIPRMLKDLNDDLHGSPMELTEKQWRAILAKMIKCFNDASEENCSKKNKYEYAYRAMWDTFSDMYGEFGHKLPRPLDGTKPGPQYQTLSPASKVVNRKDWQSLTKKYLAEEKKIYAYRKKKEDEGLKLFAEWFDDLWD